MRRGCDGYAGASGIAGHSHQLPGYIPPEYCKGAPVRRPAAIRPLSRRKTRLRAAHSSICEAASPTQSRWGRARKRYTELRIHPWAWQPGSLTTVTVMASRRRRSSAIAGHVNGQPAGELTRDDVLDNITLYWLTNTGVSSARLYWENKFNLLRAEEHLHPGCRERLSWRELSKPRAVGRSGRITNSSITTRSTKAGTSRRGSSRNSFPKRFAQDSNRYANRSEDFGALKMRAPATDSDAT